MKGKRTVAEWKVLLLLLWRSVNVAIGIDGRLRGLGGLMPDHVINIEVANTRIGGVVAWGWQYLQQFRLVHNSRRLLRVESHNSHDPVAENIFPGSLLLEVDHHLAPLVPMDFTCKTLDYSLIFQKFIVLATLICGILIWPLKRCTIRKPFQVWI